MDGIYKRTAGMLPLEHGRQCLSEGLILLRRPFFRAFGSSTGGPVFPGFMALEQETVYIVLRILPSVLMQHSRFAGQAHGGEAGILGDDNIFGAYPVHKGKIGTVGPFVNDKGEGTFLFHAMGGVADQQAVHAADFT